MTRKRNLDSAAALGGWTAALVLLMGLPAAAAQGSPDLHANQRLYQLPRDQAQVPPEAPGATGTNVHDTPAAPDQPLLGGSFPRSFLIPGTSTSIRVGGSVDETFDYGAK